MEERLILIDESDQEIGSEEKLAAHEQGKLHRAFSVFIFSSEGKLMLQKRADGKYHSAGLWTNTACGHPRPGEATIDAARRRLSEEMGFSCELFEKFTFAYKTSFPTGLIENEIDHVFFGWHDGDPKPDPEEASDWRWIDRDELEKELSENPEQYTYWLQTCFPHTRVIWPGEGVRRRAGVILVRDEKVLLIHRNRNNQVYYIIPGGGVEEGETFEQAVVRESQEELQLPVRIEREFCRYADGANDQRYFFCSFSGEPQLGDLEEFNSPTNIYGLEWIPISEFGRHTLYPLEVKEMIIAHMRGFLG